MDRARLEQVTQWASEDGLLPGITEVVKKALNEPGPYGEKTKQNMRDALVLFSSRK